MPIETKNYNMFDYVNDIKKQVKTNIQYKVGKILPYSNSMRNALNVKGIPEGSLFRYIGKSDTGKSTEALMNAKLCIVEKTAIPVYIDLENKINFDRMKIMGFPLKFVKTDLTTGESITDEEEGFEDFQGDDVALTYEGDFIHIDKSGLDEKYGKSDDEFVNGEDVFNFISELHKYQIAMAKKGIVINFLFILDSIDRIHSNRWLDQFGGTKKDLVANSMKSKAQNQSDVQYRNNVMEMVNDKYLKKTKLKSVPFSNTMILINNGYDVTIGTQSTLKPTGGHKAKHLSDMDIFFGGKLGEGITPIKKAYKGKEYEVGKRVKVEASKSHAGVDKAISKGGFVYNVAIGSIMENEIDSYWEEYKDKGFFKVLETKEAPKTQDTDKKILKG